MIFHVFKHPAPQTLAERREAPDGTPPPDGWQAMSPVEFEAWCAAEIADGWTPPPDPTPAPEPVPETVRNAQLRQWLLDQGLFDVVEAKLATPAAWPSELWRRKAVQRWEYEASVNRTDPLVLALASDLGMSPAQLDAAFIEIAAYR